MPPPVRCGSRLWRKCVSKAHRMGFLQDLEGMNYALTGAPRAPGLR